MNDALHTMGYFSKQTMRNIRNGMIAGYHTTTMSFEEMGFYMYVIEALSIGYDSKRLLTSKVIVYYYVSSAMLNSHFSLCDFYRLKFAVIRV